MGKGSCAKSTGTQEFNGVLKILCNEYFSYG